MWPKDWVENRVSLEKTVEEARKLSIEEPGVYLNLGCGPGGPVEFPNFINIDKYIQNKNILNLDIDDLSGFFGDNSVDLIYCSHALEHLPYARAIKALSEWRRVLKPGKRAIILIPNLEALCRALINENAYSVSDWEWFHFCLFGYQRSSQIHTSKRTLDDEFDPGQVHMCGFTLRTLKHYSEKAGFKMDKTLPYEGYGTPSLWFEMRKQ